MKTQTRLERIEDKWVMIKANGLSCLLFHQGERQIIRLVLWWLYYKNNENIGINSLSGME